jgi:D-alanyl-D-alanine carboxypeptidase
MALSSFKALYAVTCTISPNGGRRSIVEHLLSHTSGVPRYMETAMEKGRFLATKKAVFLSLIDESEHFKIGTKYSYNNTNFLLISAILETKTGKSYQELVANVIVKPLGLKNTGHASAKTIIKNMVTSYQVVLSINPESKNAKKQINFD